MLAETILILISIYYLNHGLYPLITGKPVFKAYNIRKAVIILVTLQLLLLLLSFFLFFVKNYGSPYGNITFGYWPFYILLLLFCTLILWFFYRHECDLTVLKHNITLLAVDSGYALIAVRDTLADMDIACRETLSGFEIPDKNITVSVIINNNQICFSVNQALDKIFLNQFCHVYQAVYQYQKFPLNRKIAIISTTLGLLMLTTATLSLFLFNPIFLTELISLESYK